MQKQKPLFVVHWATRPDNSYTVQRRLGAGSYGEVFVATRRGDTSATPHQYAMKKLRGPSSSLMDVAMQGVAEDASREVRGLLAVKAGDRCQPQLACYVDHFFGSPSNTFTIITEFVSGRNMYDLMVELSDAGEVVAEAEYRRLMRSALAGLRFLHSQDVVHRDLKEDNILVVNYGRPDSNCVIIDLGISCLNREDCNAQERTVMLNKSPEMIEAQQSGATLSLSRFKTSDVWAMALALHVFGSTRRAFESAEAKKQREIEDEARRYRKRAADTDLDGERDAQKRKELAAERARLQRRADEVRQVATNMTFRVHQDILNVQRDLFLGSTGRGLEGSKFVREKRIKRVTRDRLAGELLTKMFDLDWRTRMLPTVAIAIIDRENSLSNERFVAEF